MYITVCLFDKWRTNKMQDAFVRFYIAVYGLFRGSRGFAPHDGFCLGWGHLWRKQTVICVFKII